MFLFLLTSLFVCFLQRVFYLPITDKLKASLRVPAYREMCQHEFRRPRNKNYMSDVYDSPAWKMLMGPITFPNKRIGTCLLPCK